VSFARRLPCSPRFVVCNQGTPTGHVQLLCLTAAAARFPFEDYGPPRAGSASFGATRDFMLRHNQQRDRKLRFQLGNGDALVMAGEPSSASLLVQLAARQLGLLSHMQAV
jgi:hypothetical protein